MRRWAGSRSTPDYRGRRARLCVYTWAHMRILERLGKVFVVFGAFALATFFALRYGSGGLWRGFEPALAVTGTVQKAPYDLTRLKAVNETLKMIRDKYVDPDRV